MKENLGAPVGGPSLCISPLATNASPLDHARRAAGGKLRETMFCLHGKPGQFRVPPRDPPPELFFTDSSMKLGTRENLFTTEDTEGTEVKT